MCFHENNVTEIASQTPRHAGTTRGEQKDGKFSPRIIAQGQKQNWVCVALQINTLFPVQIMSVKSTGKCCTPKAE